MIEAIEETRRYLIKRYIYNLEVTDMCWLYEKLDLSDCKIHAFQEDRVFKYYEYICAKETAFRVKQINNMKDGQIIFANNSSYLLIDAKSEKEALKIFWKKHKELCKQFRKEKEDE